MLFSIEAYTGSSPIVYVPGQLAELLPVKEGQDLILSHGKRQCKVTIKSSGEQNSSVIKISETIISDLLIQVGVEYEVVFTNNQMIMGPVIGLLLGRNEEKLKRHLPRLVYSLFYKELNGLLFVYSEDKINFADSEITGYLFHETFPGQWKKCKLPFPGASFRRTELSARTVNKMIRALGFGFFNAEFFDKWQFWKWISTNDELIKFLPETANQINLPTLNNFVERFGGAYLKPRNGSRGKGIHFIEKEDGYYRWISNYDENIRSFSESEIASRLAKYKYYLLQAPIFLKTHENRMVDYRVLLQKNGTGFWQCTGIIARFGKPQGITANFKANGYALDGFEALKVQFGYEDLRAFQKYQEIINICTKIAQQIDRNGTFADFGIDIGIDHEEKIWVIEINKRHDHDFPLLIKNQKMYYDVKSNPLAYAKYVAMGGIYGRTEKMHL